MNVALFAYSRQGCRTADRIKTCFPEDTLRSYTVERLAGEGFSAIPKGEQSLYGEVFGWADVMVFVGACGIAVRKIAPYVRDKRTDPAVLCVDELGNFVISLLSGHIGGANELASRVAGHLGATPVITTATDINRKFSVDAWAARNGFVIDDMQLAKAVSAAILEGNIPIYSDFPVITGYPGGTQPGESGELGICVSYEKKTPFSNTLRLIPQILHLGIGCRRGTTEDAIRHAVDTVLEENRIDPRAVRCVASIDRKAEEAGLLAFCESRGLRPHFYAPARLRQVPGEFTPSAFVESVTGVDNVCERSALLGADKLIIKKTAVGGVTVAVAAEKLEVSFG